ncbi:alpha-L-arabinofuranosidase [Bifidobacterium sp. DSM 109960]|uniref:non-reducing end alpha-L-arabinofuranosidase n=1 Tax=Bifidobacterium erythrocebi TaxID=2675325 RepID=A0A7Y0EUC6_9BIFI|nr:alpha-L-arabinofuranosidase C-terminal domain-containing protein [Bifidobacterium sp. DSM 109960]NMM96590.1 alpha-L-arabinofuranosidase [Bifidobacterium sp. DSM 109960]
MVVSIDPNRTIGRIDPKLHGQFIEFLGECIDGGLWVGEDSPIENEHGYRKATLDALRALEPPVIRWPGGCYADTYHWRDGIGPKEERKTTFNENFATYELDDHSFGTDEFLRLCELLGAEPWININMLSGTVAEMKDWMEYCNREQPTDLAKEREANGHKAPYGVKYWGIGNEVWAGGGTMTPQTYLDEYRRFASAMPSFTTDVFASTQMYAIASGPDGNKPRERVKWTEDFFRGLAQYRQPPINGYDLHFYNWNVDNDADTPTEFDENGWNTVIRGCLELEDILQDQWRLMNNGLALIQESEVAMDSKLTHVDLIIGEWGNWHKTAFFARPALKQQVTMRDAITTALTLDLLQRNCDKVTMACNAQTINVLNSLILTEGGRTVLTPNFDVFMMYKAHRGMTAVDVARNDSEDSDVYAFASIDEEGKRLLVDLTNAHMSDGAEVILQLPCEADVESMETLASSDPHDCNTVEHPDVVRARDIDVNGAVYATTAGGGTQLRVQLPAASVNTLHVTLR